MKIYPTLLAGTWLIDLRPAHDERGFFARTFCQDTLRNNGLETEFPQHSVSYSHRRGTIRGMHFQRAPHEEVKLVRCMQGAVYDVVLDLRPDSPSFMRWEAFEISAQNRRQLYVPKGCAHGFQSLTDDVEMSYMISTRYAPGAADGVRYDDPAFGISWPLSPTILSERDQTWADYGPLRVRAPLSGSRSKPEHQHA